MIANFEFLFLLSKFEEKRISLVFRLIFNFNLDLDLFKTLNFFRKQKRDENGKKTGIMCFIAVKDVEETKVKKKIDIFYIKISYPDP